MRKLFSYDSPLMQGLSTVADYMLLNIIFILCCVPVVTIGAAKTALYRVMFDMLDERGNNYKRFFKAFAAEFKTITPIGLLKVAIIGFLSLEALWMIYNTQSFLAQDALRTPVTVVLVLTMLIAGMVFSNIPAQVAMFSSTRTEYLKNGIYIALTKPFRCLAVAVFDLLPIILALWDPTIVALFGPVFIFFYFTVTVNLSARIFRKPFNQYIENARN